MRHLPRRRFYPLDDDPPLIVKDEVDHHALVVSAEDIRAHVPIGPLTIVGLAAPWRGAGIPHQARPCLTPAATLTRDRGRPSQRASGKLA